MDIIPLLEENRRNILRQAVGNNQIPRILYKYCSRERALQIIGNHSIMFSSFTAFNDPFDCAVTIDGHNTPEEWHTYLSMQDMMPGYRNITEINILKDLEKAADSLKDSYWDAVKDMGIFCMSEEADNILLWSHYGEFHKGVCLRFDILGDLDTFHFPKKVIYDNNYPQKNYIREYIRNSPDLTDALWHKAKDWEYEKEYRVVKPTFNGLKKFRQEALTGIIFGCCCPEEKRREIVDKAKEKGFTAVQFMEAKRSETSYHITIHEI